MQVNQPPMFVKASNPDDLRQEMIQVNVRFARNFHFFDIQFVKGSWYAWFELKEVDRIESEMNNGKK